MNLLKKHKLYFLFFLIGKSTFCQETFIPTGTNFYISVKETVFFPKTNDYIFGFLNTNLMIGVNPNSGNTFISAGPCFSRDITDFYGFNLNYRYVGNYGMSPHNFIFNAGYRLTFGEYDEYTGKDHYSHQLIFHTVYLGIGYQFIFGKEQRFYLSAAGDVSLNFLRDNLTSTLSKAYYANGHYLKVTLDGVIAPLLEIEFGVKLGGKKAKT